MVVHHVDVQPVGRLDRRGRLGQPREVGRQDARRDLDAMAARLYATGGRPVLSDRVALGRRSRARNIASVPCRCGHSWTCGPVAEVGYAGQQRSRVLERLDVGRGGQRPAATTSRVSARCGEQVTYATTPPGRTASSAAVSSSRCSGVRPATSAGRRRQRASGRRRKAPSPVHGASTSTRSKPPGRQAGPGAVGDHDRRGPARRRRRARPTSSARCG